MSLLPPRFDPKRRRAVTFALLLVTALASFESTVVSTAMPTSRSIRVMRRSS